MGVADKLIEIVEEKRLIWYSNLRRIESLKRWENWSQIEDKHENPEKTGIIVYRLVIMYGLQPKDAKVGTVAKCLQKWIDALILYFRCFVV